MSFCISQIAGKFKDLGVLMVRKYVDDLLIYGLLSTSKDVISLMEDATGLNFTQEEPMNGILHLLDVSIILKYGLICTNWYVYISVYYKFSLVKR